MPKKTHLKVMIGEDGTKTHRKQCAGCKRWLAIGEYGFNAKGQRRCYCNDCLCADTYWRTYNKKRERLEIFAEHGLPIGGGK